MKQQTAKVFMTGKSQAVRLPKNFRFDVDEVFIEKEGDNVILSPKPSSWQNFFMSPEKADPDFLKDRRDPPPQKREPFND